MDNFKKKFSIVFLSTVKFIKKYKILFTAIIFILILIFFFMLTDKNNFVGKTSDYIVENIYEKISGNSSTAINNKNPSNIEENISTKESEDNNESATANKAEMQTTYLGNLKNEDDIDYYKFSIQSKCKLSIDFEHDNTKEGGFELKIYDSEEKELADYLSLTDTDNKDGKTYVSFSTLRLPTGEYYLAIDNYSLKDSIDINYLLTISSTNEDNYYESEFNNSLKAATPIEFNKTCTGNLVNSDDVDFYKFEVNETKDLNFTFKQSDESLVAEGIKIQIITESKEEKISFELSSEKNFKIDENFTLIAGTYYIKVSTEEDIGVSGDYILNLE